MARLVQLMAGRATGGAAGQRRGSRGRPASSPPRSPTATRKARSCWPRGLASTRPAQFDLALPLSEKAATMLDNPVAHLNLGDLLLSLAESQSDPDRARPLFERAVARVRPGAQGRSRPRSRPSTTRPGSCIRTSAAASRPSNLLQGLMKRVNASALAGRVLRHARRHPGIAGPPERCRAVVPVRAYQVARPPRAQLPLWQDARRRSQPDRAGQGLSGQGPRRAAISSARPWPRTPRGSSGSSAGPSRATDGTARPRTGPARCSTEQPRFVTVTLVLSCRSDRARASARGVDVPRWFTSQETWAPCH